MRDASFSLGLSQTKSISNQVHMAMKSACFGYADSQKNGFQISAAKKACRRVYFRGLDFLKAVPLFNENARFFESPTKS